MDRIRRKTAPDYHDLLCKLVETRAFGRNVQRAERRINTARFEAEEGHNRVTPPGRNGDARKSI